MMALTILYFEHTLQNLNMNSKVRVVSVSQSPFHPTTSSIWPRLLVQEHNNGFSFKIMTQTKLDEFNVVSKTEQTEFNVLLSTNRLYGAWTVYGMPIEKIALKALTVITV